MTSQQTSSNFYICLDRLCANFNVPRFVVKKWMTEVKAPVQKRGGKIYLPNEWVEKNKSSLLAFQKEWLANAY